MSTPESRSYQETKEAPCTILDGPWSIFRGYNLENPHCVIATIYSGGGVFYIHGQDWSYGNRWQDPTLFEELAEMIRQAPEVRKERDALKERVETEMARGEDWCGQFIEMRKERDELKARLISYQTAQ